MPHHNIPDKNRLNAKAMRYDSTRAENMLWQALRGSKLEGMKFKRQVPIENYIADFVCFQARLIIEVDGGQHSDSASDKVRDAALSELGFRTLRFWNNEVENNLNGVCEHILSVKNGGA